MKIKIATRKSALALWQAEHVADLLKQLPEVSAVELVPLSTRGDEILDRSLQKIGGKGLFIKELEVAMQAGEADIAVHSMKDVPAEMPDGFCLAALLERANHADALVSPNGEQLADLPEGALVGSSSLRRQAQLKMLRPDLRVVDRGQKRAFFHPGPFRHGKGGDPAHHLGGHGGDGFRPDRSYRLDKPFPGPSSRLDDFHPAH